MMTIQQNEKGAAATAPGAQITSDGSVYTLPEAYRKQQLYEVDGRTIFIKGGIALLLDRLVAAQPCGIDRRATLAWIANIADTVARLRRVGVHIDTHQGQPANYVLRSAVRRIKAKP